MTAYLSDLKVEIETFLYHEARLLDDLRFEDWLNLFTEDMRYWMPIHETLEDEEFHDPIAGEWAYMEEGKAFLTTRYERLKSGMAYSEKPRSRTRHFVSNVLVEAGPDSSVIAHSNFLMYQGRRDKSEQFFVGRREDRLVRDGSSWKIQERKVLLDHRVLPRAISVFF